MLVILHPVFSGSWCNEKCSVFQWIKGGFNTNYLWTLSNTTDLMFDIVLKKVSFFLFCSFHPLSSWLCQHPLVPALMQNRRKATSVECKTALTCFLSFQIPGQSGSHQASLWSFDRHGFQNCASCAERSREHLEDWKTRCVSNGWSQSVRSDGRRGVWWV